MSAATARPTTPAPAADRYRVSALGLVRSEWIKFWSVRSVVVTVLAFVVALVGLGVLFSWAGALGTENAPPQARAGIDPFSFSMLGVQLALLVVAAVGVVTVAGEYGTGMVRSSFSAAPRRLGVLGAKAVVLAVVVALVGAAAVLAAFLLGQAVFATRDLGLSLGDEHVLRALAGNVVLLVGVALSGLAVGTLLRNSAGAICTLLAVLLVVPPLLPLVPESWGGDVLQKWFFTPTTTNLVATGTTGGALSPGAGLAAFAAWVVVLLALAALVVRRRDV